jgi:hypothetical protein
MKFYECYIAGVRFRPGAADILADLDEGAAFTLQREPDNQHDPNAVKILHDGHHVGYVPAFLAPEVGRLIADNRLGACIKGPGNKINIEYTEEAA